MGFFADAYDLFVIGVAAALITSEWHIAGYQKSPLSSLALLTSAAGAVVFGRLADKLGRKKVYGFEVIVLAAGANASACSPGIWWLIAFRGILGFGIGGDYPVSTTIMSECASRHDRGRMVALVFSMQGAGLVIGPLVAIGLLKASLRPDLAWRVLLALGAVPALAVFWLRRRLRETPRFLLAQAGIAQAGLAAPGQLAAVRAAVRAGSPAGIFPVRVRTTSHGIAAAAGKLGLRRHVRADRAAARHRLPPDQRHRGRRPVRAVVDPPMPRHLLGPPHTPGPAAGDLSPYPRHPVLPRLLLPGRRPTVGRDPPPQRRRPHPRGPEVDPGRPPGRHPDLRHLGQPVGQQDPRHTRLGRPAQGPSVFHPDQRVMGQPEAQFGPLRTFVMGNSDHPHHAALTRRLQAYLRWRDANARHPDVLAAQRRERARIRSQRQQRWGRPKPKAA